MKKQNKQKKKGLIWKILTPIFAVLTAVLIAAIPITQGYSDIISNALHAQTQKVEADPNAKIYYWTAWEDQQALVDHEYELCRAIEGEGAALLVNRDNTLPLPQGTKFTPFSQSSFNLIYGGTGSGSMNADEAVSLRTALIEDFGEGCFNQDQWKFYATTKYKRVNADTTGGYQAQYRIGEVPWDKYPAKLRDTWANYGDVALVVLSRSGGEGADLPSGLPELEEFMTGGDYLRLCKEEIDMLEGLEQLKSQGVFKKIVVLLNSSNALQLDFVDKYGIDAVLWIGDVGMTGTLGVADILSGKVNPSGRIVDTFMKDNHSAPAMANFGAYKWQNGAEYDTATAQNNTDAGITKCNSDYVVYQEGIYVGYRYFETRYEDSVLGQGNSGSWNYDDCVAFPFGYGLSYTDFEYSSFKLNANHDGSFTASVDVKNVGSVDGKHTVQIYFQSPYTEYDRQHLVEKAAVELCGFDKKMIKAGETEHFEIRIDRRDLASYDANNLKTWIFEDGDYYFTVGKNAHDAVNNVLALKGAQVDGKANLAAKWTNNKFDGETFAKSSVTGNAITNLFDNADLNKYDGAEGQTVTWLSRQDWTGTYPTTQSLFITPRMWADGLTHEDAGHEAIMNKMIAEYWSDVKTVPAMGVAGNLNAGEMAEAKYDDARWAQLVSQIPYEEMTNLVYNGFHLTQAVPSINLPGTLDENGPQGFTASLMGGVSAMAYTSEDVMAATFNLELIEDMGSCIGEDFLHATEAGADKVYAGLYGPGGNIHRTPYSGRNFEYYSEDGWLSGKVSTVEVKAIRDKGVYVFMKHFALNDQEEGRYGIATWSNEQAIRELYLKAFEGPISKSGGNVMSSFNRIGVVWSGAHRGLMTGILRNEWGMIGAAITDCSVYAKYMDYRYGVLAGQDLWDGYSMGIATLDGLDKNPAIVAAVQQAVKNIAYNVTHSHAMNIGNAKIIPITPWWQKLIYTAAGVCFLLTVLGVVMWVRAAKKNKATPAPAPAA
ncbi:MAG: glycoside hydrolase family 3 C-terminal domain-containing protein [Oscillospiraceae bacterium]|nr:glycoside hydrolase family 3 C-terminal domain-containing protein [Oscillospiraceae bacterium]